MSETSTGRRRGVRERRPPPIFNSSPPPAAAKKVEKVEVKKARLDDVTAVPKPSDPSAFVQAAQQAKAPHFLPFYPTIVLDTGVKVTTVPDWLRKQAPVDAAAGKEYVGRLMGKVTLKVECPRAVRSKLLAAHKVNFSKITYRPRVLMRTWDQDGEFNSSAGQHVPVSRLLDVLNNDSSVSCAVVKAGDSSSPCYSSPPSSPSPSPPSPPARAAAGVAAGARRGGTRGATAAAAAAAAATDAAAASTTKGNGKGKAKNAARGGGASGSASSSTSAGVVGADGGGDGGEAPSGGSDEAVELLQHVYALQSPQSSPWGRPMLRALSTHVKDDDGARSGLTITYYVYTSRLLFELIADPAISGMMKSLEPVAHVTPPAVLEEQPVQFISNRPSFRGPPPSSPGPAPAPPADAAAAVPTRSEDGGAAGTGSGGRRAGSGKGGRGSRSGGNSDDDDGDGNGTELGSVETVAAQREYDFSLAGILKSAESSGYRIVDPQPADLTVELFQYQRSSCQWMLDHERDPRGLNGYFWERREWADGGAPLWYFPLAGEFRLAEPPHITGGLLCEEMGLGKTMEVLSTILANPRDGGILSSLQNRLALREGRPRYDDAMRVVSRATLIVVPVSLVGQWAEEIRKNSRPGALRVITLAGPVVRYVPLSEISLTGPNPYPGAGMGRQRRVCTAPYYAPGETAAAPGGAWVRRGVADLTAEQARWIENHHSGTAATATPIANGADDGASGPAAGAAEGEGDVTVRVEFKYDANFVADNDVVLTTYELLRSKPTTFRKINFHRCVLDECQEIKTATTNIARMCQQVKASHRWMVSGTPITGKIDSLHGELNFLQVWPFSLQNDGFWEKKVSEPFAAKDQGALELLRALIGVVMMRHSKSQTYVDGRPLVKIPVRTVEWRGVDFSAMPESGQYANASAPHARYVYKYLEHLCATVCRKMEESAAAFAGGAAGGGAGGAAGGAEANGMGRREFTRLKSLLSLMQKASTHPALVNLGQLDLIKRSIQAVAPTAPHVQLHWVLHPGHMGGGQLAAMQANVRAELKARADAIETLPAEEVLRRLAQKGSGNMGGLNRDVNRNWAVGGEAEMKLRDSLEALPLTDLQQRLEEEGLPVPRSWAVLRPKADIETGSVNLRFGVSPGDASSSSAGAAQGGAADNGKGKGKGKRKRDGLASTSQQPFDARKVLKVSDTIRVGVNTEDNESTVEAVEERSATLSSSWAPGPVKAGAVYRFSVSSRRKPYVDLLVASDKAKKETEVQVAGFSAIYKAMAGEPVSCPICMCSVVRPTVTKCAHLFCRECISRELQRTPALGMVQVPQAKCPICRRTMKGPEMMELQTLSEVEEAVALDASGSSASGASEAAASGAGSVGTIGDKEEEEEEEEEEKATPTNAKGRGKGKGKGKRKADCEAFGVGKKTEGMQSDGGGSPGHEHGAAAAATGMSADTGVDATGTGATPRAASPAFDTPGESSPPLAAGNGAPAAPTTASVAAAAQGGSSTGNGALDRSSSRGSGPGSNGGRSRRGSPVAGGGASGEAAGVSAPAVDSVAGPAAETGAEAGAGGGGGSEEGETGPSLVIPTFRFTATATRGELDSALPAPFNLPRDNSVPSLETRFLSQYRAATSSRSSVKLDALVRDMDTTLLHDPASKFVIFSQYPQVVDRAGEVLQARGIRSTSIVGGRTRQERSSAVSLFTTEPSIKVILLTTGSAAAGLTLTAASTVYMLDPVWSAADEAQALNRAHRIGQTQTVRCVVFYMRDSVEERLLALRNSKGNFAQFLESADSMVSLATSEAGSGSFVNLFALTELKKLFGMVGAQAGASDAAQGGGAAGGAAGAGGAGAAGVSIHAAGAVNVSGFDSNDNTDDYDGSDDSDDGSGHDLEGEDDGGDDGARAGSDGGGAVEIEERDLARAIALSRAEWEAISGGGSSSSGGGGSSAGGGAGGASSSPVDLTTS
eukprot:g11214.t1